MSKKYKVIDNDSYEYFGLKVGDIVTKIEGSTNNDLYELPKHLHGKGHTAAIQNGHLNLQEPNYFYLARHRLKRIKGVKKHG